MVFINLDFMYFMVLVLIKVVKMVLVDVDGLMLKVFGVISFLIW